MTKPNDYVYPLADPFGKAAPIFGLSKREYFAGLALQGQLAVGSGKSFTDLAIRSVKAADSLIAALNSDQERNEL